MGGATVSTTVDGKTVSVLTPTTGAVGTFAIPNLPTPATYVLNYSAPGHGTWTEVVELAAGQSYAKALGKLGSGSGTISGIVRDGGSGSPLGGVTVTVGGSAAATVPPGRAPRAVAPTATSPTTTTLTNGNVGGFSFSGLADGHYTVSFGLDGYTAASVPVLVDSNRPPGRRAPVVQVRLYKQAGDITGTVFVAGVPTSGATLHRHRRHADLHRDHELRRRAAAAGRLRPRQPAARHLLGDRVGRRGAPADPDRHRGSRPHGDRPGPHLAGD